MKTCNPKEVEEFDLTLLYTTQRYRGTLPATSSAAIANNKAISEVNTSVQAEEPEPHLQTAGDAEIPSATDVSTNDIPKEIQGLCRTIKEGKKNKNGLPTRVFLRTELKKDFTPRYGELRKNSPLFNYVGDPRLFTAEEWAWLAESPSRAESGGEA
jgi:hypothetical protein